MERSGPQGVGVDRRAQQGEDEVCPTLLVPTASPGSPSPPLEPLTPLEALSPPLEAPSLPLEAPPHLGLETLHQDGHQQVEEHIIAKGHEGNEVEGGPGGGGSHAVVEDDVPVLLGKDLSGERIDCLAPQYPRPQPPGCPSCRHTAAHAHLHTASSHNRAHPGSSRIMASAGAQPQTQVHAHVCTHTHTHTHTPFSSCCLACPHPQGLHHTLLP